MRKESPKREEIHKRKVKKKARKKCCKIQKSQ